MAAGTASLADRQEALATLARHRVFSHVPRAALQTLADSARLSLLGTRETLFAMGDPGQALFIITTGWIKLVRTGANGRDIVLELAGAGSLFGELAAITGAPRGANAVALAPTRVLAINADMLVPTLRQYPDSLLELTRIVCDRLAKVNAQLEDTLSVSAEVRLARALIRLAALNENPSEEGLLADLGLSQKDLGDATGLSREGTNKQLALWRDAGLIRLEGRIVALLDPLRLQQIADMA